MPKGIRLKPEQIVAKLREKHKRQNFSLLLNGDRGLRGCDVFGFVNPYTFSELKNPRF